MYYTLEHFNSYFGDCDDMMIAEEGFISDKFSKIINGLKRLLDAIYVAICKFINKFRGDYEIILDKTSCAKLEELEGILMEIFKCDTSREAEYFCEKFDNAFLALTTMNRANWEEVNHISATFGMTYNFDSVHRSLVNGRKEVRERIKKLEQLESEISAANKKKQFTGRELNEYNIRMERQIENTKVYIEYWKRNNEVNAWLLKHAKAGVNLADQQ